jgi:transcriptional antiterminator RfaH
MSVHWYALRSKSRKEDVVWRQLREQGVEVFYPRLRVHTVNPRARQVRPYFPGYLFVQADLEATGLSFFQWLPHAVGLVTFGGEPSAVPENLIHTLRQRVEEIAAAGGQVFDGLEAGERVRIHHGPFEGYEAIFDARIPGTERVRVLLQFLNARNVPVEIGVGSIERIKRSGG